MYAVQMAFYMGKLTILFVYTHENFFSGTSEKPLPHPLSNVLTYLPHPVVNVEHIRGNKQCCLSPFLKTCLQVKGS